MKIIITDEAMADIRTIYEYIYNNLQNPAAAETCSEKIFRSCNRLSLYPNMGVSLREKTGVDSDSRCLMCGNYIAFYRILSDTVRIDRIVDGRTEYMKTIF